MLAAVTLLLSSHRFGFILTVQPQAHEGGLERTARRYVDCLARNKTPSLDKFGEEQQRALQPLRLISTGTGLDVDLASSVV